MNLSLLNKFEDRHVMIIGDVMLDRYLYGAVGRISPEAPVPVLDYEGTDHRLGGAANVALNILAMDGAVTLIGMIGADEEGALFRNLLQESEISDEWLFTHPSRCTTLKTRVMARGQHLLRVDREDRSPLDPLFENDLLDQIRKSISTREPEGIILQDYNKGMLTSTIIEETIQQANKLDIPVFVDPKVNHISSYSNCTIFKPNLTEASAILGYNIYVGEEDLNKAAEKIQKIVCHTTTLITLSDKGLFLKRKSKKGMLIPSIPQEIADVCGAGDTVICALALSYLSGGSDEDIANISNIAGHIACRYPGVVPVQLKQLKSEINR